MKPLLTFIFIFIFTFNFIYAQSEDKDTKGGLGLQMGMGFLYGGLGFMAEYQKPFNENFRLTTIGSIGIQNGGEESNPADYYWIGYNLGLQAEIGKSRRFIIGTSLMINRNIFNKPQNAVIYKKNLLGSTYFAGFKGTSYKGIIWQLNLGATYIQNPLRLTKKYYWQPIIGLGGGYKF